MIPEESIFPVGDDKYVYKVVDGRAQRQKVEIGQRRDGKVEVLGGLGAAGHGGDRRRREAARRRAGARRERRAAAAQPVRQGRAGAPPKGNS